MKPLLRVQTDLFASPAPPPELINSERQKAVALLRALLMEAVMTPARAPSNGAETEAGDE